MTRVYKTYFEEMRDNLPEMVAQHISGVQPVTNYPVKFSFYSKKYWPYQHYFGYKFNYSQLAEIERWCWRNFKGRYWRSHDRFYAFKRQEDFNWFIMRWS